MSDSTQAHLNLKKTYHDLCLKEKNIDMNLTLVKNKYSSHYEMDLLHKYNEIKDATQILLGVIGNIEGLTIKELHKKFELPTSE